MPRRYRTSVNRLAGETSPYLLQHADNPVDWYPWGEEALARAREEDKPILLSIGYAACHWCHVMEHESFEDDVTAALMNERFVCIKVDREERPDLDGIYMDAVTAMTGHGGWPLTVFLTPAGEPFLGGTYYPPEPRHGLPSFQQVLVAVSDLYRERREDVTRRTQVLVDALEQAASPAPSPEPLTDSLLSAAVRRLGELFDPEWGGFGGAPKFPPASALELLLRRGETEMVVKTLDAMAAGGMYDLVGGGFHRYSVDERWLVPHFEKMLYDNALLVPAYLHGWLVLGEERYRRIAEETLEYMLRELRLPHGGFASAQDADTDGVEGLTFTWTEEEGVPAELLQPFEDGRGIIRGDLSPETGSLTDYADVANGLYELHVTTGDLRWLRESLRLARLAVELFADAERGGFFLTPADGEELVARTKSFDDNPTPSGNSMLAYVLLRLARIYGDDELERRAVSVLRLVAPALARAPSAFGH